MRCWTEQPDFIDIVKQCSERSKSDNLIWVFHQKIKKLGTIFSSWSKSQFGDIHAKVKDYEERINIAEEELICQNSNDARSKLHRLNVEYKRFLKLEESILRQKSQIYWFKDGDANTRYFHVLLRGRRRKLFIHRVKDEEGDWIQGDEEIVEAACNHFQQIFTSEDKLINEEVLNCIPEMVNQDQNEMLQSMPDMDELKQVVFFMSPHLASG